MQRALVIGIPGAGKSTFSRALAAKTGLPIIHLDTEFWQPDWEITPREQWRVKVAQLLERDAWIMDGNYGATLDLHGRHLEPVVLRRDRDAVRILHRLPVN